MADTQTKTVAGNTVQVNPNEPKKKLTHAEFAVKIIKGLTAGTEYTGVHTVWRSRGADGVKRPSFNTLFAEYFGLDKPATYVAIDKLVADKVISKVTVKGGYLLHLYDPNFGKTAKVKAENTAVKDTLASLLK